MHSRLVPGLLLLLCPIFSPPQSASAKNLPVRIDPADPAVSTFVSISNLKAIGNTLYFAANDGLHGVELWKTDGTNDGTVMVKDINPAGDSSPECLVDRNGLLYFFATTAAGKRLWKSDGTADGTVMIDAPLGPSDVPYEMTKMGGSLFLATPGKLWKSNGTAAGTVMLKNFGSSGSLYNLTAFPDKLLFVGKEPVNGSELWRSDGTSSGTLIVKNIGSGNRDAGLYWLTAANELLYFFSLALGGRALGYSDGTAEGTKFICSWSPSYFIDNICPVEDSIYVLEHYITVPYCHFNRYNPYATVSIVGLYYNFGGMIEYNGMIFFGYGDALYKSKGEGGTYRVKVLNSTGDNAAIANMAVIYGKLYFTATPGNGRYLWVTNGLSSGTEVVSSSVDDSVRPIATQYSLFFTLNETGPPAGKSLWTLDLGRSAAADWQVFE